MNITHDAYANPVNGGWDGYQGTCRDCDWLGPLHEASSGGKHTAKHDAAWHAYGTQELLSEALDAFVTARAGAYEEGDHA